MKKIVELVKQIVNVAYMECNNNKFLAVLDIIICGIVFGASPNNYKNFDFKNASWKERNSYITHRLNNKLMKKYNLSTSIYKFEDKYEFASIFKQYYGRKYYKSNEINVKELQELLRKSKIIVKPLRGGKEGIFRFFQQKVI